MLSSQVITDEEELHKMSMECEPPSGGLPPPPPLSTVLASSLPNITPQITLNTTLLHLSFSPRPASETHRPPPPRWAQPPRRRRNTPLGRTRTSTLARSSPSSQKRSIDCRSRSWLPHQISLVSLVDFVLSSTPWRIPISITLANLSVTHCSQRRRESTGGEEAPIVEWTITNKGAKNKTTTSMMKFSDISIIMNLRWRQASETWPRADPTSRRTLQASTGRRPCPPPWRGAPLGCPTLLPR